MEQSIKMNQNASAAKVLEVRSQYDVSQFQSIQDVYSSSSTTHLLIQTASNQMGSYWLCPKILSCQ